MNNVQNTVRVNSFINQRNDFRITLDTITCNVTAKVTYEVCIKVYKGIRWRKRNHYAFTNKNDAVKKFDELAIK